MAAPSLLRPVVWSLWAVLLLVSVPAEALAYPRVPRKSCTPNFSGLTQTIRHSSNVKLGWMAVAGNSRGVEGVKAAKLTKSSLAEMEWFVEPLALPPARNARARAAQRQKFEISAATSTSVCLSHNRAQTPFADDSPSGSSCTDAHSFYITCDSCDVHDDSAWGCQIESVARDLCVEGRDGSGELSWKNCVVGDGRGLRNQLFDISSSF